MKRKTLALFLLVGITLGLVVALSFYLGKAPVKEPLERSERVVVEKVTRSMQEVLAEPEVRDVQKLIRDWEMSHAFEEWDACASGLAEADTVESVEALVQGVFETADWEARVKLARNLKAVSNPEVVPVLLRALGMDFGRGSPVVGEICDVISRLAQPDTVEALAAMHWQANGQGVESHKVIRAVAGIRNPAARKALGKLVADESAAESLRAAAQAAVEAMAEREG